MTNPKYNSAWARLSKQTRATAASLGTVCARCGNPIDYTLPATDRMSATVDHQVPLALDGDPLPTDPQALAVMHRACNSKGGGQLSAALQRARSTPVKTQAQRPDLIIQLVGSPGIPRSEWLSKHVRPDQDQILDDHDLVTHYGDYSRITKAAWTRWRQELRHAVAQHCGPGRLIVTTPTPAAIAPGIQVVDLTSGKPRAGATTSTNHTDHDDRMVHDPTSPTKINTINNSEMQNENEIGNEKENAILSAPNAAPPAIVLRSVFDHTSGLLSSTSGYGSAPPRLFSDPHPDAVGTMGGEWGGWVKKEMGFELRPWQQLVFDRALEVDKDNRLVWRDVVVSTPRQSGKSWLIKALACARAEHSQEFYGEPVEQYHLAMTLVAARRLHSSAWRWAENRGLIVKRAMGVEQIIWDDGSHWSISSLNAIYGASGDVILDEGWDIPAEVVHAAIEPILLERPNAQMWIVSTSNQNSTGLIPEFREKALKGSRSCMIAEWSAPPGADERSEDVWRAASPHWSERRRELLAAAAGTPQMRYQYLNQWPGTERGKPRGWPEGWDQCERSPELVPLVAAVEVSQDRSRYGAAVGGRLPDGRFALRCTSAPDLDGLLGQLTGFGVGSVLAGITLKEDVVGPWQVHPVGSKETRVATPLMADLVRRGMVLHDHDPVAGVEVKGAEVTETELGPMLSARRSQGSIAVLKSAVWVVYALQNPDLYSPPQAQIW